jgi:uncharacterized membrane protein YcaP (DUF421 family)
MFFHNLHDIWRVIVVGVCAYLALIALLRVSGKRTLSKMNAFDLTVTVALGSTLATVLLSEDVSLLEGITAFSVLIVLQFIIAWLSVRSTRVRRLVKSEPTLLFYQGTFLDEAMRKERVTEEEARAAVRAQGVASMNEVLAIVLETDGSLTVLVSSQHAPTALQGVRHYPVHSGGEG